MTTKLFLTLEQFELARKYYANDMHIVDQDEKHVMGWLSITNYGKQYDYYAGEDITDKDLSGIQNAWFAPNGKILFVPWHGHDFVACIMGKKCGDLEDEGWVHFSYGSACNRVKKITDRQYDSIAKFADINDLEAAAIAREKSNDHDQW